MVADWTWPGQENKPLTVEVYSSCEEVELFLNGKSLGVKPTTRATKFMATWSVPYQPGELKAIGRTSNKEVSTATLKSADKPVRISLTPDRQTIKANGQDLSYITVELVDSKGVRNPKVENALKFELIGPGTIVGVGNANPRSTESYQRPQRNAWQGRALVIVKSSEQMGKITLRASADSLPVAEVAVVAE